MDGVLLCFTMNLKTGFFKAEPRVVFVYESHLIVHNDLSHRSSGEIIDNAAIRSITLSGHSPCEIEIVTDQDTLVGILSKNTDLDAVSQVLKSIYDKKIII